MKLEQQIKKEQTIRAQIYRLLADTFLVPHPKLISVIEELVSDLERLESQASKNAVHLRQACFHPTDFESLSIDYVRLFVGPFMAAAPPYGSVYLENKRQMMGDSTMDVQRHYLSLGLDLSPDFKEAPDHISAELEFMHVLICKAMATLESGDYDELMQAIRHQKVFLEHHLAAWIPDFANHIMDHAQTDYYRSLAEVTQEFIAEEVDVMSEMDVA